MSKPSTTEIEKQVKWLEQNKTKVRRYSIFGDDNWQKIDAALIVLKKDLSEDDIYDRSLGEDDEPDDSKDWSYQEREAALYARAWMDGDEKTSPTENWEALVGK